MCRIGRINLALIILGYVKNWLYIGPTMKNLIIHPKDPTTEFLSPIYADLEDKTVIKGGIGKTDLRGLIESHDRIIMLGHGCPYGLLNPGQFTGSGLLIVDESMVPALKYKSNCIYIWCYADRFVQSCGLSGLCSGMFISEVGEANINGYVEIDRDLVEQSNKRFALIVSKYINESLFSLYTILLQEYKILAKTNSIAQFNAERLFLY